MSKSPGPPCTIQQGFNAFPFTFFVFCEYHLTNSLAILNNECFI